MTERAPLSVYADVTIIFHEIVKNPARTEDMSNEELDIFGDRMLLLIANLKGEKNGRRSD